jgi:exosome complex component MTR3
LPRNAGFSSNLQLTLHVKFTPFATRKRRGYIRDATERDIGTHLETALNGVIIPDRWPKSAIDIVITIIEAEDDIDWGMQESLPVGGIAIMNVVSGCITVASAALLNARIDCLDLVTGGVAALATDHEGKTVKVLDPSSSENPSLTSVCVVGYMPARDEITLIWAKGDISTEQGEQMGGFDGLLDSAVNAANGAHFVLRQVATELAQAQVSQFTNDESKT